MKGLITLAIAFIAMFSISCQKTVIIQPVLLEQPSNLHKFSFDNWPPSGAPNLEYLKRQETVMTNFVNVLSNSLQVIPSSVGRTPLYLFPGNQFAIQLPAYGGTLNFLFDVHGNGKIVVTKEKLTIEQVSWTQAAPADSGFFLHGNCMIVYLNNHEAYTILLSE